MKFSLIIPTKERLSELERLLRSLADQTCQDFEVIVSDQNEDDRLVPFLRGLGWTDRLIHLKSSGGASCARNRGIDRASGEIICFPDDDCAYPPLLLEQVANFFANHPEYGYLTGRSFVDDGRNSVSRHSKQAAPINRYRIFAQCIEFAIFLRKSRLGDFRFNESFGPGNPSPWQADEGPDLLLRLEGNGVHGYYDPQFAVWHPQPITQFDTKTLNRSYSYSRATGHFLRLHHFPFWFLAYLNLRTSCGLMFAILTLQIGRAAYYKARLRGIWQGWSD